MGISVLTNDQNNHGWYDLTEALQLKILLLTNTIFHTRMVCKQWKQTVDKHIKTLTPKNIDFNSMQQASVSFPKVETINFQAIRSTILCQRIRIGGATETFYSNFEDFLSHMKSSKRKSIRQERKSIAKQGLEVKVLVGEEIKSHHWDVFYEFYLDTIDRKWGQAYLTRDFFANLGMALGDNVVLIVAYEGDEMIAGALNLKGDKALFGRNWGCKFGRTYKNLHFEVCYYKALEFAIELGLERVEAGAQGEHKIQRGYIPQMTYSSHYIVDPQLRSIIKRYLGNEQLDIQWTLDVLKQEASPYKQAT
eukprot:TRINITY_DN2621_c0_g1_i10.p2 TRINITY_DN2621_c0_g1~~TRINITY_DN2621_c0_g1_i10.p2  ORF type:complete len:307 (-),score=34.20 TRINITY_DN2621_c0_g1_i10:295-1215(-)